jgi:hypothetical protein
VTYEVVVIESVTTREEAVNWVIANHLGRRNLTPEQKSYLRGKRYNLEKRQDEGHGDQRSDRQNVGQTTAERLGEEYAVDPRTIERDGAFAEATDTLEQQVREDLRQAGDFPQNDGITAESLAAQPGALR